MQSVSGEENENQANGQGMKFVSVIVKIKLAYIKKMCTAYDLLTFIFVYGTSAFYLQ